MKTKLRPLAIALTLVAPLVLATSSSASAAPAPPVGWQAPVAVEPDWDNDSVYNLVGRDAAGNVIAVWEQWNGNFYAPMTARYTPSGGWGVPQLLEWMSVQHMRLSVASGGNAVVVWQSEGPGTEHIYASEFTPAGGWTAAHRIDLENAYGAKDPEVAVDANGAGYAVWEKYNGGDSDAMAAHFVSGAGWGSAVVVDEDRPYAETPQVALDAHGNAFVAWAQNDKNISRRSIGVNRYDSALGAWTGRVWLNGGSDAYDTTPALVADAAGNAAVAWTEGFGVYALYSSRYTVGTGWSAVVRVSDDPAGGVTEQSVALDPHGKAVVAWVQAGTVRTAFEGDAWGFGPSLALEGAQAGYRSRQVAFVVSEHRDITYVWSRYENYPERVWCRQWPNGEGLRAAFEVDLEWESAALPAISADGEGNAMLVWTQLNGSDWHIWSSRFVEDFPPEITIETPASGTVVDASAVEVTGYAEPGATVVVNGYTLTAAADGSFAVTIPLLAGVNTINATARDAAGNERLATRSVTYSNSNADLEAQVAALADQVAAQQALLEEKEAEAAGLREQLDAANGSIALAGAELEAAEGALAAVQANASATAAELEAAQAAVAAARESLDTLKTRHDTLQADFDAAQAEVSATQDELAESQEALSLAQAQVSALQAELSAASAALEAAQDDLNASNKQISNLEAQKAASSGPSQADADAVTNAAAASQLAILGTLVGIAGFVAAVRARRR